MPALIFLALMVAVPIAEIALLIEVGSIIGTLPTVALVILTAFIGTALIRYQGRGVLVEARRTLDSGGTPVAAVVDGVFLLVAGALLLTPGFVTDAIGFVFLIPGARRSIAFAIWSQIQKHGTVSTYSSGSGAGFQSGSPGGGPAGKTTIIDADYVEVRREPDDKEKGAGKPRPDSPWNPESGS